MNTCPIALSSKQRPNALAILSTAEKLTYSELEILVQRLCGSLKDYEEQVIAFIPSQTPETIALFFAIWRMGKVAYPMSPSLPAAIVEQRLHQLGAKRVTPTLGTPLATSHLDPKKLALMIETSGTTTTPKIVCHILESLLLGSFAAATALSLTEEDRYCLNLPLFHISGIATILRTVTAGATLLLDHSFPATHISMVPTQLYRLLNQKNPLPELKCLLLGGGPCSPTLFNEAIERGLPLYTTYGMSETGAMATLKEPHIPGLHAGKPLSPLSLKLSHEKEILLRGPTLFSHYWGETPRKKDEWFATRDLGSLDAMLNLHIIGRKDRQFISGGENIQPEEIESALLGLGPVIEARVTPRPDREFGMLPTAELYCSEKIRLEEIQERLRESLPSFKIPKEITISDAPLGKTKAIAGHRE
ncbi:MAG: 2-succinylbenzoate--CoA ligase [Chlamydiae bacterium]|nr:2-succinylbenzoate--CoA ligase [Chlamydiota bacterium]